MLVQSLRVIRDGTIDDFLERLLNRSIARKNGEDVCLAEVMIRPGPHPPRHHHLTVQDGSNHAGVFGP